ncbi:hypothetical protein PR048_001457 [Dryococelus australis]|uniref:C2H2-type domain-containing protein n=1 Tax=Dryococelus australis TaxID=614101 RepID=A0ABQ9IHF3_9NEOP|nr:hypothetical protein PR048_001457 [Dryococelus australis]
MGSSPPPPVYIQQTSSVLTCLRKFQGRGGNINIGPRGGGGQLGNSSVETASLELRHDGELERRLENSGRRYRGTCEVCSARVHHAGVPIIHVEASHRSLRSAPRTIQEEMSTGPRERVVAGGGAAGKGEGHLRSLQNFSHPRWLSVYHPQSVGTAIMQHLSNPGVVCGLPTANNRQQRRQLRDLRPRVGTSTSMFARMEQRQNARAREMGDQRENPPTRAIVRHDSHLRKSGIMTRQFGTYNGSLGPKKLSYATRAVRLPALAVRWRPGRAESIRAKGRGPTLSPPSPSGTHEVPPSKLPSPFQYGSSARRGQSRGVARDTSLDGRVTLLSVYKTFALSLHLDDLRLIRPGQDAEPNIKDCELCSFVRRVIHNHQRYRCQASSCHRSIARRVHISLLHKAGDTIPPTNPTRRNLSSMAANEKQGHCGTSPTKQLLRQPDKKIPEKTRRPAASSGTIPTCESPGVTRPGIETGSPWWEASSPTAQPPRSSLLMNEAGPYLGQALYRRRGEARVCCAHRTIHLQGPQFSYVNKDTPHVTNHIWLIDGLQSDAKPVNSWPTAGMHPVPLLVVNYGNSNLLWPRVGRTAGTCPGLLAAIITSNNRVLPRQGKPRIELRVIFLNARTALPLCCRRLIAITATAQWTKPHMLVHVATSSAGCCQTRA